MIRKITVQLTIIHLLFSSDATYNNKQMVNMMYKYLHAMFQTYNNDKPKTA